MKIIHVLGTLNTGGIQKYILQLSQSLLLNQYTHQVLCTIISIDNYKDEYEKNHISIQHLPFTYSPKHNIPHKLDKLFRYLFSRLYFFRIWYYLIRSEIDIVHTHIHSQIISQILATVLSSRRIIWTIHGEYSLGKITIWIIRILNSILPSKKIKIIADSKSALQHTLPYTQRNPDLDNIIPTGIDLEPYLQKKDKSPIRKKFNIKEDTILIGSTGRIVWQKGYDQLLSLLENYDFGEKIFHILIAGDGSLRNKYIEEIESRHLEDRITFIGNINNIPEFLSNLDIYIQPSVTEGFPLSVLEAMASGLPVISSDAGGLKEMIHNKENGITYRTGDLNALHNSFLTMFSMSPDELFHLGQNARKTVQDKYSINNSSQQYKNLYNL